MSNDGWRLGPVQRREASCWLPGCANRLEADSTTLYCRGHEYRGREWLSRPQLGWTVRRPCTEVVEDVLVALAGGPAPLSVVAARLGMRPQAVEKAVERAGRHDLARTMRRAS